jgi:hypothetical protein
MPAGTDMKAYARVALCLLAGAAASASAHHSFAPHFDPESSVTITGTIVRFHPRNPHSYLYIDVDEGGEHHEYTCESSGITQLSRNGIDAALLEPGSTITVTGQRHRRDPNKCFFRTVQVGDGPVLAATGAGATLDAEEEKYAAEKSSGIFGNWLLIPSGEGAGNGETYAEMLDYMTKEGQRAEAAYNAMADDPVYRCNPIGIRRTWFAPGTPTEISLHDDRVVIRHEWMDVERVVYLDPDHSPDGETRAMFGHSVGRLENGVLTIETDHYPAGLIRQYIGREGEPYRGLLHSDELTTTEILEFDEERQSLEVTMLFRDPGYYSRDFPVVTTRYERTDLAVRPFGCTPDSELPGAGQRTPGDA